MHTDLTSSASRSMIHTATNASTNKEHSIEHAGVNCHPAQDQFLGLVILDYRMSFTPLDSISQWDSIDSSTAVKQSLRHFSNLWPPDVIAYKSTYISSRRPSSDGWSCGLSWISPLVHCTFVNKAPQTGWTSWVELQGTQHFEGR